MPLQEVSKPAVFGLQRSMCLFDFSRAHSTYLVIGNQNPHDCAVIPAVILDEWRIPVLPPSGRLQERQSHNTAIVRK
jgi:hypothetical protein